MGNRELDRQIAEKYYSMEWIQEEGDELHGWNWHPCDIRYPPYTSSYLGLIPRYAADLDAVKDVEKKIEEYNCFDEYQRALEALGAKLDAATAEQRCRAALEIHPVYERKVKESLDAEAAKRNLEFNTQKKRAEEIIDGIKQRLIKLAENRPFRFIDTEREDARRYLRTMKSFSGYDENEMYGVRLMNGPAGNFPHVFAAYLRKMGKERGALFSGSDAEPESMSEYRQQAEELLEGCGVKSFLDENSVVFMFHQGYSFLYFQASYNILFDAPIYQYTEGEAGPKQVAAGFTELLDAEVSLMEENNRAAHESGGYLITVMGDYVRTVYPALSNGARPIDMDDEFI